jgi:AcrR family transcriptional regulator
MPPFATATDEIAIGAERMTSDEGAADAAPRRSQRADARRNYEALLVAAADAFTDVGSSASLEDIARRAGVGIGTLYRHFPTRQALFEAVYVHEVEALCRSAADAAELAPWDALVTWLRRFARYLGTKRAVVEELAKESELLASCRDAIFAAGSPLLARAQATGAARPDATFEDVLQLVMGITLIQFGGPDQVERLLGMVLDGIRPQPAG